MDESRGYSVQLYPHIEKIVQVLSKNPDLLQGSAVLPFIRYRFLKEAYALSLYRPYPEGHRLSNLLNWLYFPDEKVETKREINERISFILSFNNDYQIYKHIAVLIDRVLSNPIHLTYLRDVLPRFCLLMVLFGDYQQAVDLSRQATEIIPSTSEDASFSNTLLKLELECIRFDAESHIPLPSDFSHCEALEHFVVRIKTLVDRTSPEPNSGFSEYEPLLRMAYACYFRAIVRTVLHLRQRTNTHYRLPNGLPDLIENYHKIASKYMKSLDLSPDATNRDPNIIPESYRPLHYSVHYSGLDMDTLARTYACLSTELALRKVRPQIDQQKKYADPTSRYRDAADAEIKEALRKAGECLTAAEELFDIGDKEDERFILTESPEEDFLTATVKCNLLSSYRLLSSTAIYELHQAYFCQGKTGKAEFESHINKAKEAREKFEHRVGPANLRHSRVLNERIKTMIEATTYVKRLEWVELLSTH